MKMSGDCVSSGDWEPCCIDLAESPIIHRYAGIKIHTRPAALEIDFFLMIESSMYMEEAGFSLDRLDMGDLPPIWGDRCRGTKR